MKTHIKILAACLIVLSAACKKETGEVNVQKKTETISLKTSMGYVDSCANPMNPYDTIGYLHNIVLDSVRRYVKLTGDTSRKGMVSYLGNYFLSHYGQKVKHVDHPNQKLGSLDYKAIMLNQNVSATSLGLFKELSGTLDGIKDLDHYASYRDKIMVTEAKILNAPIPEREKRNLLITASVLRYSGGYWMKAFKEDNVRQVLHLYSFLRKVAGVIAGIGADASVMAYCYFHNILDIVDATVTWSAVCGYYTGWY